VRKDVFISYSKDDREWAEQVCSQLEEAGIGCWIAPRDIAPGVTWPAAITEAIRNCRAMVVVFSSNANRSPHMAREVEVADSRHVPILPVRVEEIEPAGDMEYFLGNRQWFDLHGGKIERRRALPDAIASLLRDVTAGETSGPAPASPAPQPGAPPKRSIPGWAAGLGVVVLVGAGITGYRMTRPAPAPVAPPPAASTSPAPTPTPAPAAQAPPPAVTETPRPGKQAKSAAPPAALGAKSEAAPAKPVANFSGKWQAEVKYNWGAVHKETFNFKVDDQELFGTASYLRTPRGVVDGKIEGNKITFTTRSPTILGDRTYEEKHHYRGRLTADGIEFLLQTDSGYDSRSPETFTAKRIE
jgi:hypothetical protein